MNFLDALGNPAIYQPPRRLTRYSAWQKHLPFACLIMALHRPKVVVELGVHAGDSYCGLCQSVDALGLDTRCYGVDTWLDDPHAEYYGDEILRDLRQHHDPLYDAFSQLIQTTFDDALQLFADGSIDLLHLDGLHTYEAARNAFDSWRPKLSDHGIVLLHDTNVRDGEFGVWRLWAELAKVHPSKEFAFGHGLGVLALSSPHPTAAERLFALDDSEWEDLSRLFAALGERVEYLAERRHLGFGAADLLGMPSYADMRDAVGRAQSRAGELEAAVADLRGEVVRARDEAADLRGGLVRGQNDVAHMRALVDEYAKLVDEYAMSTSWRITAPVRRASQVFRPRQSAPNGNAALRSGSRPAPPPAWSQPGGIDYVDWLRRFPSLEESQVPRLRVDAEAMDGVTFSVLMPVYNPVPHHLSAAIESVLAQIYPRWQLCIADDASTDPEVGAILDGFRARDTRIHVVRRKANGHISAASNSALELATGEFLVLFDHDDELAPEALYVIAKEIAAWPDVTIVYSDEDKIDRAGRRFDPHFKPDFNPSLLLGQNYINHLGVYRHDLVQVVGGFRIGFEGSQDWDLMLRCVARSQPHQVRHVPRVLYHWRVGAGSAALSVAEKPYAADAGRRAVQEHLAATGVAGVVTPASLPFVNRIAFDLPDPRPLVSIIIPTRNCADLLKRCIDSVRERTTYPEYEVIIVDNASDDPDAVSYLRELEASSNCRVLRYEASFNFSAINNLGASEANGKLLLLLNNDTEVITPGWVEEMAMWAIQPDVGTVGCKLLYPDGTLQHGGVILGMGGIAEHAHKGIRSDAPGYFGRLQLAHDVGANTAACAMVRAEVFNELGGLNADDLTVAFNDVDFCLRVSEVGLRNVWTPHAVLYHHESKTRGSDDTFEKQERARRESEYMAWRWADALRDDRFYSPNLTREAQDFSLAVPPRVGSVMALVRHESAPALDPMDRVGR